MNKFSKHLSPVFCLSYLCVLPMISFAGGEFDTIVSLNTPDTVPPGAAFIDAETRTIKWDPRCQPSNYIIDSDNLPNAGTEFEIDLDSYVALMSEAFQTWTDVDTSFIEPQIAEARPIADADFRFDFINTISFEPLAAFDGPGGTAARAPSSSLSMDADFVAGDDLDGDGDSDVFDPATTDISVCHDYDNDGDIEFPAGFYLGGTILDADIIFDDAEIWASRIEDTGININGNNVLDLLAISIHEVGHNISMAHSMVVTDSSSNASNPTMFPSFSPNSVAFSEMRTLSEDDKAWISFNYPEGSASEGPAALQPGDRAFAEAYSILEGEVTINGEPQLATHITATSFNGDIIIGGYGGTTGLIAPVGNPTAFQVDLDSVGVNQSRYKIPVPNILPSSYRIKIEGVDGDPVATNQINIDMIASGIFNAVESIEPDITEVFFSGESIDTFEAQPNPFPSFDFPAFVFPESDPEVNFILPTTTRIETPLPMGGLFIDGPGTWYIKRFDRSEVLDLINAGSPLLGVRVFTSPPTDSNNFIDSASKPVFGRLILATGEPDAEGEVILNEITEIRDSFIGDDIDFTFIRLNGILSEVVRANLTFINPNADLYLAVEQIESINSLGDLASSPIGGATANDEDSFIILAPNTIEDPITPTTLTWLMGLEFLTQP